MITLFCILSLILVPDTGRSYSLTDRQRDTLLIYNRYRDNISFLQKCTVYEDWYKKYIEIESDNDIVCAKLRLKKYNNSKSYPPIRIYDKEGFGTAFEYPNLDIDTIPSFSIIDLQTKFIINQRTGRTKIPYIEVLYFSDRRRLIKVQKLDPVKLTPIFE